MAYTIRFYAPLDAGISHLQVGIVELPMGPSGTFISQNWPPAGVGVPAATYENTTCAYNITPIMLNGSSSTVYRWVVNIDGVVSYYENRQTFGFMPAGTEKLVQIRVEMPGSQTTFFGNVTLNANGGSLGSIKSSYSLEGSAEAVGGIYVNRFTLPSEKPKRDGYVFTGWGDAATNPSVVLSAGKTLELQVSAFPPGPSYSYYAQWSKESSGTARIHNGSKFVKHIPYVHDGTRFKKAIPHIWNGGWKKGI